MIGDRIIEINDFTLEYDGVFVVKFSYNSINYEKKVYLTPVMLIQILKNEGILDSISEYDFYSEALKFQKSTLQFEVFDHDDKTISFLTSEEAEQYQQNRLYLINCILK